MKEIDEIIRAFEKASAQNTKTALATVVHVDGSAYRRPGARMLVTESGELTGAISGGCLEGDALRKALLAIHECQNKLVTYDTNNEDDAQFGVQLGCNGIIHILFEPIHANSVQNPVTLLKRAVTDRTYSVIVTLFSLNQKENQPGTSYLMSEDRFFTNDKNLELVLPPGLLQDAKTALNTQNSMVRQYDHDLTAFIELVEPKLSLIIFGAGNDAIPLSQMASILGWDTTIVDGRHTHINTQRFPLAQRTLISKAESALGDLVLDNRTACVLMTHNYNYDLEILRQLSAKNCSYIGILGPKKKFMRMIDDLAGNGCEIPPSAMQNMYSPVGLDVGAETAEEIALSIAAEIKAVFSDSNPGFLRDKTESIHAKTQKHTE